MFRVRHVVLRNALYVSQQYAPDSNLLYVAEWSCVLVTKDMSLKPTSVPGLLPVFTFEGWAGKEDAFPRNF